MGKAPLQSYGGVLLRGVAAPQEKGETGKPHLPSAKASALGFCPSPATLPLAILTGGPRTLTYKPSVQAWGR